jgi:hypothetical protein
MAVGKQILWRCLRNQIVNFVVAEDDDFVTRKQLTLKKFCRCWRKPGIVEKALIWLE